MQLYYSTKFVRSYRKLPQRIKNLADKKVGIFIKDPFSKILKTHKLHGDFVEFWALSINRDYRITFDFLDKTTIRLYDIGTHGIYK